MRSKEEKVSISFLFSDLPLYVHSNTSGSAPVPIHASERLDLVVVFFSLALFPDDDWARLSWTADVFLTRRQQRSFHRKERRILARLGREVWRGEEEEGGKRKQRERRVMTTERVKKGGDGEEEEVMVVADQTQ